jgi:SAM-dependent methyltransferase
VQAAVPDAMMLNKSVLSDEITQIARRALPEFGLLVAALNALLIFLLLGRVELVLVTLLPMAAGMLWTLGTLGLCGLPVDVANFVFVIFIVGVGGDYSLFLVLGELEPLRGHPERTAATGAAVAMCALTALLGTGVLVLAHHPALFSVGLTALLGISYSLLATLFLLPMSLRWLVRFNARRPDESLVTTAQRRRAVHRLYRFQGPYVSQFAWWKMKTDPLFRVVENAAPLRGEILDLGCGYGLVAHWLTLGGTERRVFGLDFDPDKIRVAQATARANPQTSFAQGDLLAGPEYPACDGVLLCDVLHYFPRELKAEVLRKIFVALRPGGRLVLRDACAEATSGHGIVAWAEKWAVRLGQNRTRYGLHFEDERTHLALLREAGFAKMEVRGGSGLGSNLLLIATKAGVLTT